MSTDTHATDILVLAILEEDLDVKLSGVSPDST